MESDDEWEEEEPGESLSHSEGVSEDSITSISQFHILQCNDPLLDCLEVQLCVRSWWWRGYFQEDEEEGGDEGGNDDEDDEDGFLVPHGYLSDDEGALEEEVSMLLSIPAGGICSNKLTFELAR